MVWLREASPKHSVGGCLARSWPQATERHVDCEASPERSEGEGVGLRRFPGSIGGAGVWPHFFLSTPNIPALNISPSAELLPMVSSLASAS